MKKISSKFQLFLKIIMAKNEPYRAVLYAFMKKNERMSKKDVIEANSNLPVHQSPIVGTTL